MLIAFIYDRLDLGEVLKLCWIIFVDLVPVLAVIVPLETLEELTLGVLASFFLTEGVFSSFLAELGFLYDYFLKRVPVEVTLLSKGLYFFLESALSVFFI